MAKGKTIRELLVSLGVNADTSSVKKFDKAIDSTKSGMASAALSALKFSNKSTAALKRFSQSAGRALSAADKSFNAFGDSIKNNQKRMKGFAKAAGGLSAGIAVAVGGMVLTASSAAKAGDSIGKASKRALTGSGEFQELAFGASEAGVSIGSLEGALKKQLISLGSAKQGLKASKDAFAALGISIADASKMSQGELFRAIADGLKNIKDDATRSRVSIDVFGRSGLDLGPMLKGGAAGIDAAAMSARKLGLILSDEAIKSTEEYTDSMGRLTLSLSAFKNRVGILIIKAMLPLIDSINQFTENNQPLIKQLAKLTPLLIGLVAAISAMASIGVVIASIGFFVSALSAIAAAATAAAAAVGMTLLPFLGVLAVGIAFISQIIITFVAGLAIVALTINDIWVTMNGGDSVLRRFIDKFKESKGIIGFVARTVSSLVGGLSSLWDITKSVAGIFMDLTSIFIDLNLEYLDAIFTSISNTLSDIFGIDLGPISSGLAQIEGVVTKMMLGLKTVSSFAGRLNGITGSLSESVSRNGIRSIAPVAASSSQSMTQSVINNIKGSDPVAIGAEVNAAMEAQYRAAIAAFKGGLR